MVKTIKEFQMKINDISILYESFLSSKEKQNEVSKKIKDLKLQIFSKLNKDITYTAKYKIQKKMIFVPSKTISESEYIQLRMKKMKIRKLKNIFNLLSDHLNKDFSDYEILNTSTKLHNIFKNDAIDNENRSAM